MSVGLQHLCVLENFRQKQAHHPQSTITLSPIDILRRRPALGPAVSCGDTAGSVSFKTSSGLMSTTSPEWRPPFSWDADFLLTLCNNLIPAFLANLPRTMMGSSPISSEDGSIDHSGFRPSLEIREWRVRPETPRGGMERFLVDSVFGRGANLTVGDGFVEEHEDRSELGAKRVGELRMCKSQERVSDEKRRLVTRTVAWSSR